MMRLSTLPKTWLLDLDGTLVVHNGHRNGGDRLLPGVAALARQIAAEDAVILLSARETAFREASLNMLRECGLRIDHALFGLPVGERLLFNDRKPGGLKMAYAVNLRRDEGPGAFACLSDPAR